MTLPIDGAARSEVVGELRLGRGAELGDVPDEARLGEVEVERHEPGVERLTNRRAVAMSVDSTRNHGGASSSLLVRLLMDVSPRPT